ncbi:MAG: YdcF family protein [Acidobacteriota bacterium]|nr:MAG: YdcF family protein [Acidobacteriota bacterium]
MSPVTTLLTSPLGWAWLIGIVAIMWRLIVFGRDRRRDRSGRPASMWPWVLAWLITMLAASPFAADQLAGRLERLGRDWPPPPAWARRGSPEAIVVFSGGLAGRPVAGAPLGQASTERLHTALRAAARWPQAVVLVSGGSRSGQPVSAGSRIVEDALALGLEPERVIPEHASRNTRENALRSVELLREQGISRAVLVTSIEHMPRARSAMARAGMLVAAEPVPPPVRGGFRWAHLAPDIGALRRTTSALHEWLGLTYYWMRGWLATQPEEPLAAGRAD